MSASVLWHNPRCSKSRTAVDLLNSEDVEFRVVKYLETPPNRGELEKVLSMLNLEPRALIRKNEKVYKELGLDDRSLSRDALIDHMVKHPILIERPVFIHNGRAIIGRPPENVLTLLKEM